jgi:membrane associated rhomboid family serine protease
LDKEQPGGKGGMAFATILQTELMFIPVGDDNRDRRTTPYINWLFIALNVLVFIFLQKMGNDYRFTFAYATVPAEILTGNDYISEAREFVEPISGQRMTMPGLERTPIPVYLTLITSMFMHGGWAHLFGNMLFLLVFGDNIEDAMGHRRYFYFYLLCGVLAALSHVFVSAFTNQSAYVPSLGASGAISAVMGGYMLLFPTRSVHMWIFFFIVSVPAFLAVGIWFVFQVINGMGMLGGEEAAGGVAYAAHIGGFIAGLLLVKLFVRRDRVKQLKMVDEEEEEPRW